MDLHSEIRDDILTIRLDESRLDAAIAIQFKDNIRHQLAQAPGVVVLDLASVTFVDSSGLGAIVAMMKVAGPSRRFMLSGITPNVARVLRLTRMDTVLTILSEGASPLSDPVPPATPESHARLA